MKAEEILSLIIDGTLDIESAKALLKESAEPVEAVEPVVESKQVEVKIASFFDSPMVEGEYSDENILFVESVEGNKNFCGSGKVTVLNREIMANLCESDGTAYINLTIDIGGKLLENVQFKLKQSDDNTKNQVCIRKDILDE